MRVYHTSLMPYGKEKYLVPRRTTIKHKVSLLHDVPRHV
jgi:hypothetical protein